MKQTFVTRLALVAGLLGGLAHQPAPPARPVAAKPAAAQLVPAFLIDRAVRPAASDVRNTLVDRDPPDRCFEPSTPANAHRRLACG